MAPLNKCLNLDPSYDNAAIAIGVSLSKLERFDEAEAILKASAKIQPQNALIKQNLAVPWPVQGSLQMPCRIFAKQHRWHQTIRPC